MTGTYWDTQVLDSSWVSAYVQGGWVGMTLLGLWVVLTGWGVLRIARPARAFWVALFVYCMLWGITASGLLDSYVLFILMATDLPGRGENDAFLGERRRRRLTETPGVGPSHDGGRDGHHGSKERRSVPRTMGRPVGDRVGVLAPGLGDRDLPGDVGGDPVHRSLDA